MKTIEVDEELYRFIASRTQRIGESASDILRRLLDVDGIAKLEAESVEATPETDNEPTGAATPIIVGKPSQSIDPIKQIRSELISDEFAALDKAIDRFMFVLSALHRIDKDGFAEATQVKGRKRVYFADNEAVLLASGTTTKPRAIPGSPFWVITNNNTSRKRQMVEQLMVRMSFPAELIERVARSI
ncbi:replication initiation regulator SeqA [Vibrio breoganii]|uniref:replication initiation negative regulator SeqA n=1 Tax=Vibrio breoganii TaxID=553239 RepID=UPI0002E42BF1|nr:replication initiation negative regulator SeqA [Vibrio breoganii]OED97991.1 replication initiation regulator SeqA [Vibrio breoganii ZF-29]OEF87997.1 replication initiation regulator SeqA [Vibrio breoganii 1C10]PMG93995.1 replication initiation regulator SeqA [Vibrio breoganii]PMI23485.1 replication initiation regulator SeqA [Vibrio breoganii]PMJ48420.1 replication initiation regulator SeqA [Vibrio breoganii]